MILEKDRNVALFIHLTGFGSYFFPMGSILFPFIVRELKKNESEFMNILTKDVANFNLTYLLYAILLKILVVPLFVGSFFGNIFRFSNPSFYMDCDSFNFFHFGTLIGILSIIKFVLIIKAALSAHKGEYYTYPYVIEFVK